MKRQEIIFELAKYADPSWYHSLLSWKTEHLNLLLKYYQGELKVMPVARRAGQNTWMRMYKGVPFGLVPFNEVTRLIVIRSGATS